MERNKSKKQKRKVRSTLLSDGPLETFATEASPFLFSDQLMNRTFAGTCRKGTGFTWTPAENELYVQFLKINEDLFGYSSKQRQLAGIHKMMSEHIISKSPGQCRSHHQKVLRKYKTIENIISMCQPKVVNPPPEVLDSQGKVILQSRWSRELIDCSELEQEEQQVSLWSKAMRESQQNGNDSLMY